MSAIRPVQAKELFNGTDLDNWRTRDGSAAGWTVEMGLLR